MIEIDNFSLFFWLPAELDHVCEVFSTKPFPTALILTNKTPSDPRLNRHWLSRLPKHVKAQKFRDRFLAYVASNPLVLREFRDFYAAR